MRYFAFILVLFLYQTGNSQQDFLAKQYFNDGEFEKAMVFYEKLAAQHPRRTDYAEALVATYQQLERYQEAESFLIEKIDEENPYPTLLIDLGYNYSLRGQPEKAREYYLQALGTVENHPNYGYGIGYKFQRYTLLDYALQAYQRAMELNPQLDYYFQIARIYGEQGDIEKMYDAYLDLIDRGRTSKSNVLRNIEEFLKEDPEYENNILLKKLLLKRAQRQPDLLWNELLSWLFVQQGQYKNAFSQEKAIYKRAQGSTLQRLEGLGRMALKDESIAEAREIFEFITDNGNDPVTRLNARLHLIDIELIDQDGANLERIDQEFKKLMDAYGFHGQTVQLQIAYSNFLAFRQGEADSAIQILKQSLEIPLSKYSEAYIKNALGDILVFSQRFNEALIYFAQVQKSLKNDIRGQEARFKVAQTSFYKGDFDWALTQLKVLRNSSSQLIANDAMQLSLLISDNSLEDSTQTALKKYAAADLLAYQNKTSEAIAALNDILEFHKGESIEDEALFRQASLLRERKDYNAAQFNYQKIIEFHGNGILADDAHFALAELYRNEFDQPEKAMQHYEKILYQYQDSYYFPQARKNFRKLRGDEIN